MLQGAASNRGKTGQKDGDEIGGEQKKECTIDGGYGWTEPLCIWGKERGGMFFFICTGILGVEIYRSYIFFLCGLYFHGICGYATGFTYPLNTPPFVFHRLFDFF